MTAPPAPDMVTVWVTVLADVLVEVGTTVNVLEPGRILVIHVSWLVIEVEKLEAGAAFTVPNASNASKPNWSDISAGCRVVVLAAKVDNTLQSSLARTGLED